MNRAVYLDLDERKIVARCLKEKVGISATERLPSGGTRLVCMSSYGAEHIRRTLNRHLIEGEVVRERHRPDRPMW